MKACVKTPRCVNCSDVFQRLRDNVTHVVVSKPFGRDLPGFDTAIVTDCEHLHARRLHKFEKAVGGAHVFRALVDGMHVVYAIAGDAIVFLRAFKNLKDYDGFLSRSAAVERVIRQTVKTSP